DVEGPRREYNGEGLLASPRHPLAVETRRSREARRSRDEGDPRGLSRIKFGGPKPISGTQALPLAGDGSCKSVRAGVVQLADGRLQALHDSAAAGLHAGAVLLDVRRARLVNRREPREP